MSAACEDKQVAMVGDAFCRAGQALQSSADLIAPGAQVSMGPLPPGAAATFSTGTRRRLTSAPTPAPSSSIDPFGLNALVWWPPAYSNATAILFGSQLINNISSVMATFSTYGAPFSPPQSQFITTTYAPPPPASGPPPPSPPPSSPPIGAPSSPPIALPPTGLGPLVAPSSPALTPTSTASVAQVFREYKSLHLHCGVVPSCCYACIVHFRLLRRRI